MAEGRCAAWRVAHPQPGGELNVTVPPNTDARVYTDAREGQPVVASWVGEDGALRNAPAVGALRGDRQTFVVGSGTTAFSW